MRSEKDSVRPTPGAAYKTVAIGETGHQDQAWEKPTPPDDLWEKLEKALENDVSARPPNSFTRAEFEVKFKLKRCAAGERIRKLRDAGKIRSVGTGRNFYYIWIGDDNG